MSSGVHAHAEFEVRRRSEVNLRRASMGWALFTTMLVACAPAEIDDPVEAQRSALTQVTGFGANPGGLAMFVHVPASLPPNPALVVAMHGCTQSAAAYANAGWNALADQYGFIVLYPQTTANNACFSWFIGAQQSRSGAEVTSIVNMVNHLRTTRSVDPSRVYVTGLSAGGAMTSVLLATHPDVFRAGAVMAGLPFACAQTQLDAFNCMNSPPDRTPQQWGDLVRAVPGTAGLPAPRVSIWHGTSDFTVRPGNLTELVDQWTNVNAVDAVADATSTVGPATRREYRNVQGQTRVESWTISNMSHGTAVDPRRGCGTAGAFILDVQVCSSRFAAEFFGLAPMTSLDGGVVDAGSPVPDAGPVDAGGASPDAGGVDGGTPDAGAGDAGTRPDAGGFVCRDFTAANFTHLGALRATACGGGSANFCAVGSGDDLGTVNSVTSVREVAPGFFERGTCAGGAGGGAAGGGTAGGGPAAGGGSAGGGSSGGSAFTCVEHAGFNYEHVVAFRAQSCPAAAAACAVGSGDNLGLFSNRTTLREVRPGYYELGACPSGAGGGSATGGGSGGATAGGVAGGASGGTAGGATAGGASGGTSGGSAGGSAGGASGGTSGGSAGGASGGMSGGSAGGASGGTSGGTTAGGTAGASGGTSGGTAGGSAGGASGGASAGGASGGATAGGVAGGAATGGGGGSVGSTNGCGATGGAGSPLFLLVLAFLSHRGALRRLKRSAASSASVVVVVSQT